MGGPGLGIVTALGPDAVQTLVLAAICDEGFVLDAQPRAFRDQSGLPYGYTVQRADVDHEPDQWRRLEVELGIAIQTEAVVMAFVSDGRCRAPLARLAQRIACASRGWVDLDGDISRPYGRDPIADLADHLKRAGRCEVSGGSYYLDAPAMAAWLRHPAFHVIK